MMRSAFAFLAFFLVFVLSFAPAQAKLVEITINKIGQKMTVRVDGRVEYVWPVSTGASGYTTPSGKFKPFRLEEEHFSKEWDNAPMPHSIFFTERGHAIHGTLYEKSLGRPVSHGCVRLSQENARELFGLVQEAGLSNVRVNVKGGFFDFGSSSRRSFADVGGDIDKTINQKRKTTGWSLFGSTKKPKKVAAKKPVKPAAKVAAAKKPDTKGKVAAAVAKKEDPKVKKVVVAAKKPDDKAKKVVDAKCTTKDGKKVCPKVPAVKAASNG